MKLLISLFSSNRFVVSLCFSLSMKVMWEAHGYIWYGYELEGLDNIPDSGPAIIVYYHGALPVDYYYLSSKCLLTKKRSIYSVADRFMFKIPGQYSN